MKPTTPPLVLLAALAACTAAPPDDGPEVASSAAATLGTFQVQAHIFCPTGTWCGANSRAQLERRWLDSVAEMNLQYRPTGVSFQALPPIITQDDRFSGMRGGGDEETALNGELNDDLEAELIATRGDTDRDVITMFLAPNLGKCWNGVPCPGADDGYDGDDVIFCTPPGGNVGYTYAHEMGHYWCLRHTHSGADPGTFGMVHDYDSDVCDTLINVHDTPTDPGQEEDSDTAAWSQWCEKTVTDDVATMSPHDSRCEVTCFQRIPGQGVVEIPFYAPLTSNAMSYYGADCRGPYIVDGTRYEAFTAGQTAQIAQCRVAVPIRTQLVDVCAGRGGDADHDGWCDTDDRCPGAANASNADADGDGIGDDCDACDNDATTLAQNVNGDGDTWCNVHDKCPAKSSSSNADSDGDGVGNACDTCPNDADPTNLDTDGDGQGDVCDSDDDNDGCSDRTDQHPKNDQSRAGVAIHVNCSPSSSTTYASEAGDVDGDGIRDCRDTDDDGDGIPDADDPCPFLANSSLCMSAGGSCPLHPIFHTCRGGACNQLLLRIVSVINPDPTTSVLLDVVSVVRDEIVVAPLTGRTAGDSVQAFRAALTLPSGRRPSGALRLELVDKAGRVVMDVSTYVPSQVRTGALTGSQVLVKLPSASGVLDVSTR